jgi:hypothetical protein
VEPTAIARRGSEAAGAAGSLFDFQGATGVARLNADTSVGYPYDPAVLPVASCLENT